MPFDSKTTVAEKVELGGFILSKSQVANIKNAKPLVPTPAQLEAISMKTSSYLSDHNYDEARLCGESLLIRSKKNIDTSVDIGDVRVTFTFIPCGPTTIMA